MHGKNIFTQPDGLVMDEQTATDFYGRFTIEPLEKGFGHTLGNSLRRILLSSMEGVAATAIRIDGVQHEFATLSGVREDVAEIILNIKKVHFACNGADLPQTLELKVSGSGVVTAGNIAEIAGITVINKDQVICELDKNIDFRMEIEIDGGRGYHPSEENKKSEHAVGTIVVDSLFSPIERVRYIVSDCRVGQHTDYDSLELEVWTDGRIAPLRAVQISAQILRDYLAVFCNDDIVSPLSFQGHRGSQLSEEEQELLDHMLTSVGEIEFSVRAKNCLNTANINVIGQLVEKAEGEMLKYRNFGKKSLQEIKEKLQELGLSLGMPISENVRNAFHQKLGQ